jgi:uncharacterized protein
MDEKIVGEIKHQLNALKTEQCVSIPLAVESGSRAWGFPSPDSDYDCRFIYVPHIDDALSLFAKRDVIEMPLTPVFDVNGWELRKAIKLMLKGNAVVLEWLNSPIVYEKDQSFVAAMLGLGAKAFQRGTLANHYRRLMTGKQAEHFADRSNVPLKKVFYALRSALAIRYLAVNSDVNALPMRIQDLCDGADIDIYIKEEIDELIAKKSVTGELGHGPLSPSFAALMEEADIQAGGLSEKSLPLRDGVLAEADRLYLHLLRSFAPT